MTITGPDPLTAARPDQPAAKTRRLMLSGGGFWTALWGSRSGKIGLILVGITLLGALVSILGLAPYDPQYQDAAANLAAPSADHWLGTDNFGRDLFSLVLEGIVVSLEIAVLATLIAGVLGSIGGIVAGYLGGTTSTLIMRASDILFAIPAILLALAIAWAILAEASLSFLGLGPPPPTASLGQMVSDSSSLAGIAWWTLAAPSIAIIIAVVGFNYLGDGLRDAADPRSRRS